MINYEPIKILFEIGNFTIYSWGFMFVIAFLLSFFLILKQAKKQNIEEKHIYNLGLLLLIGAIIGARFLHILKNSAFYFNNPMEILSLSHGGMTSYGGIFLAIFFGWLYIKKQKLNIGIIFDLFAPYIALAFAIGRIGCFLNWCCYGQASNLPWAISAAEDIARHPTQIYLLATNLIVFSFLIYFRKIKNRTKKIIFNKPGSLFFLFLIFYSVFRFFIDFLRVYEIYFLNLALSQWIWLGLIIISLILLLKKKPCF